MLNRNRAFIEAARNGDTKAVRELLNNGAEINYQTQAGDPPLVEECASSYGGDTALFGAAFNGHMETVRELLKLGAKIDLQDDDGNIALFGAAYNGYKDIVRELLISRAEINNHQEKNGFSALILAAGKGHLEIVRELLDCGAEINHQDLYGNTALIEAAYEGHIEVVREILNHGAEINFQNNNNDYTMLDRIECMGHAEVVQIIKEEIEEQKAYAGKRKEIFTFFSQDKSYLLKDLVDIIDDYGRPAGIPKPTRKT